MNLKHHKLKETSAWGTELKDFVAKLVLAWSYALGSSGDTAKRGSQCFLVVAKSSHEISKLLCVCVCVCVLVTQSCLTLCYPMDYSLSGSSVYGILQARILEWAAIPFSRVASVYSKFYLEMEASEESCLSCLWGRGGMVTIHSAIVCEI